MKQKWCLVLLSTAGDPRRHIGGLPLALRLALDAQAAGAIAVVVDRDAGSILEALRDPRLGIPRVATAPPGVSRVEVEATTLAHKATYRELFADAGAEPTSIRLAEGMPPPPIPWAFAPISVTDARSAKLAERALFRSLRKAEDGWTSRWLNRYVSLAISRLLVRTSLTPNQISAFIVTIGLAGGWLASRGTYPALLAGATLFQLQSILDGCDGEVSRVTHRGSWLGEWLDTIGDDITNYSFFAGAAVGLARTSSHPWYWVVGGLALGCGLLATGIEYAYLVRIGSGDLLKYPLSQATTSRGGRLGNLAPLFKRDTFVLMSWLAAWLNLVPVMLLLFACGAVGALVAVLGTELRMARERRERPLS